MKKPTKGNSHRSAMLMELYDTSVSQLCARGKYHETGESGIKRGQYVL
jgi:hypothetical protein